MINLITIILVTTTLSLTGVYSPNPEKPINGDDQIVVVEYADVNTKVEISPTEVDKDLGQAQKTKETHNGPYGAGTRELICDAYGKCKHKLASGWSKAKEKVIESEEEVKEKVGETLNKVKDKVEEYTQGVRRNAKEKVEKAEGIAEMVKEKVSERVSETTSEVKGKAKAMVEETTDNARQKGVMGKMRLFDIVKKWIGLVMGSIGYVLRAKWVFPLMGMVQIMGFSIAYGTSIWVTFIMSHVLVGVLPRQQFGMVQSKIYPIYFKTMVVSIGLALVGHLVGERGKVLEDKGVMFQVHNLVGSMLLVLFNLMFLEPKVTKVMFGRMRREKEEGRGRREQATPRRVIDGSMSNTGATSPDELRRKLNNVEERLKKLNSLSSLLNIMTLMGLTWHLLYLTHRISGVNRT